MCGAGLHVRAWGGAVGGRVRQSRALRSCSLGAAAVHAGLSGLAGVGGVCFQRGGYDLENG